ncbi:MAG: DUF4271 domain-containing protein [Rikenellaceae bacterium]
MITTLEPIADIPQYLFGTGSYRVVTDQIAAAATLSGNNIRLWIALFALFLAAIYLSWVNHWSAHGISHIKLFRFLGPHRGNYDAKLELVTPSFINYLRTGSTIGFMTFLICAITSLGYFGSGELLTEWQTYLALMACVVAIYLYQTVVVRVIGVVINSKQFAQTIIYIKAISLNIFTLAITPAVLCYTLSRAVMQDIMFYLVLTLVIASLITLIYESFLLFLEKKVSLLHTILYLCAVEIFPVTLIWGIFCR